MRLTESVDQSESSGKEDDGDDQPVISDSIHHQSSRPYQLSFFHILVV